MEKGDLMLSFGEWGVDALRGSSEKRRFFSKRVLAIGKWIHDVFSFVLEEDEGRRSD